MDLEEVYADAYGVVSCDKERKLVQVVWLKHCSGPNLRTVLSEALKCTVSHQLTSWLCDARQTYYTDIADQRWMLQELFPSFDRNKQHRVALLISIENFELMTVIQLRNEEVFNEDFGSFIKMGFFLSQENAEKWLTL